jgi:LPS-assembly protein
MLTSEFPLLPSGQQGNNAPMTFRTRIFIIVALLCHVFLTPALLISQLQHQPRSTQADAGAAAATAEPGEEVTIKAREQEKQGNLYKLRGNAEVDFRTYVLRADEMTYNADTGEVTLTGHVILEGGPHDEYVKASHGTYNIHTDSGKFYDVVGSTGAKMRGRGVMLTTSTPFSFTGAEVEKVGRDKFIVRNGRVTSCTLPKPKWTFNAKEVEVVAGENAKIYHSTFRLFGVPVFYFPFVEHPVERLARQSGFLLPHVGNSTIRGFTIGDAFYWAMNRSMDTTLGAEYYSRRGWAQRGEFRWRPSETAFLNVNYFGVIDRGSAITQTIFVPGVGNTLVTNNPGGEEARLNGEANLPHGFRGVADIDYLNQLLFRVVYAERFSEAINTEVKSIGFASRTDDGYLLNAWASRYQNFQSTTPGDVITIVHAPSGEFSSVERKAGQSPFYWAFDGATEGLSRRQPGFVTNDVVGRFDIEPNISLPLKWKGWSFAPALSLRDTYYTQQQTTLPTGGLAPVSDPINRRALDAAFEIRPPALGKVFDKTLFNHKVKHTIEPRVRYEMVSGVDNFRQILRFDERDVLADTNEIEYGVVNRFFAKRVAKPECENAAEKADPTNGDESDEAKKPAAVEQKAGCEVLNSREIVSWELAQKYFFDPTFGGALIPGQRNVFTTTVDFTGIAFLFQPRRFSPVISRLRINNGAKADLDWQVDYDTVMNRINSSIALVNFKLRENLSFSAGHAYLQTPAEMTISSTPALPKFNQFRTQVSFGNLNRRGLNAAALVGYDAFQGALQYAAVQTTYNWDCCGFTFEYRRFKFGSIRDESQYRFALTLANIATFGTMRKQERLF